MAVAIIMRFRDLDAQIYDALGAELGVNENPPEGLIFHWAGEVNGAWTLNDVWESREQFDRFAADHVLPAVQKVAGEQIEPPEITESQVHNYLKP